MTADLYITDGTIRINLLSGIDGFYLLEWTPTIPPTKQTWRDSPLSDGRKLALSRWGNATETFRLRVGRFTQNDVIQDLQELRRLLLAAREYFIGGSDVPVWIEARGDCETNSRYAVICDWRAETDDDPYHKPFAFDHPVVDAFTLILERQHWRHLPPGQSECVELSATQDYYDEQTGNWVPLVSDDDCFVDHSAATITLNGNLRLGNAGGPVIYASGIRFRNVAIPQGAYIINAWVRLRADANLAANNVNVVIACDDVDNSAIFTTYADFIGRARTATTQQWNIIPAWVAGTDYDTPRIRDVIQEVVSRPGWASGNAMTVLFDDNASTAGATRTASSWDGANDPVLYVWWFDSTTRTFGRTATCNNEVYIANKHNMAQLTHIFVDDGGVFGGNLIGAALPFNLLPAAPAVNDAVYFGITSSAPNSGPFCSLVFDIGTAQVDLTTVTWQYYNAGWVALTVRDNTNADGAGTGDPFDTTGVNSVHWAQPSDWITHTINGVTAWWVRALVGVVGAAPAAPTQQNRDVYTIIWPFVETTAANVTGDIQALCRQYLEGQAGNSNTALNTNHLLAGLRSYSRGANYTAYINLSDEQNPTGITVTDSGPAGFGTSSTTPSGRAAIWTTVGIAARARLVTVALSTPLAEQYIGSFRCFLRLKVTTDIDNLYWLVLGGYATGVTGGLPYWISEPKKAPGTTLWRYIDFGKITLGQVAYDQGKVIQEIALSIYGEAVAATSVILSDIILLPVDECFVDTRSITDVISGAYSTAASLGYLLGLFRSLNMSSLEPRRFVTIEAESRVTNAVMQGWMHNTVSPLIWQPNERQRWWYFMEGLDTTNLGPQPEMSLSAQSWHVARYLSMRGAR